MRELIKYTQLRISEKQTDAMQEFETMAVILSLAFSGGKKTKETEVKNKDQLKAVLGRLKK